jgi:hypothetical protein
LTSPRRTAQRDYRWYLRRVLPLAAPLALLVGTAGPGLTHDDEDELMGGAHRPEDSRTPRGEGHGAQQHNMRLVGFNNLQARSAYQPIIHHQGRRWIAYIGHHGGTAFNPMTGVNEPNGTSIVDVTDPGRPVYLKHIPGAAGVGEAGGAQMVRACNGRDLPKGDPSKVYLLRATASSHEVYDVTNPSNPSLVKVVIANLGDTHKSWWECDTGIALLVSDGRQQGWRVSRMAKVYDLSDPANPVFLRNFGLVGQEPGSTLPDNQVPINLHGPISLGPNGDASGAGKNRIYFGYGTNSRGVLQIVDRDKLLNDPSLGPLVPDTATSTGPRIRPSPAQLLFPQLGKLDLFPSAGAHTTLPVLRVPVPDFADNTQGAVRDFVVITNEAIANECRENRQLVYLADVTTESTPFPVSNYQVPESEGNFCQKGGRFGSHSSSENFTPVYYKRVVFFAWFNAGVRALDIRDPFNPVEIASYIPATTPDTDQRCVTTNGVETCKIAIQTNNVDVDDRGYIIIVDRANTGMHLLELTGDARRAANFP